MFVAAMLFLVGYWTILSYDHVRDAKLIPFAGTVGVYLLVAHMGTIISPRQIMVQRMTVVV